MRKTILAAALAALPFLVLAQTAPAPVPDPTAQQALSAAANQNATSAYNAGIGYYDQQAYQAAANTAQSISNQDAANIGSSYIAPGGTGVGFGFSDAWQQAADQAQSVANENQALAEGEIPVQQQSQTSQNAAYSAEVAAAPAVAQANSAAAQSAASAGAAQSNNSIAQSTGVQQGQPTVTNNTGEYLLAGAATQAAMNGFSTTGFAANKTAYQDAQNAASCGNPGCAAGWMAANAVEQNIANGAYAANVAAAPVLSTVLTTAAAASALSSAAGTLQQIQSMTGVQQGQTTGSTDTRQALTQTASQTGVQQGQSATMASADTSYTSAADSQQATLNAASQQNQNDALTAAQAGIAGLNAEYSGNAASEIASYDNSQAQSTGDPTWTQAAGIAQQQVDQQQGIYSTQQAIQTSATNDGNATYSAATAVAPGIGNTLNTAASTAATTNAVNTLQQIGAATGVPQNGQ
ncbi:MAG: hypothetical protein HKL99_14425 [Burkholderiales bacterium]|nr:hypothetical protein [Burkholderiales bacterium]